MFKQTLYMGKSQKKEAKKTISALEEKKKILY